MIIARWRISPSIHIQPGSVGEYRDSGPRDIKIIRNVWSMPACPLRQNLEGAGIPAIISLVRVLSRSILAPCSNNELCLLLNIARK
jgi:hypothetical protein